MTKETSRERAPVDVSDGLVGLGLVCIGAALWFLVGWAGVLALCGVLLIAVGVAEANRRSR